MSMSSLPLSMGRQSLGAQSLARTDQFLYQILVEEFLRARRLHVFVQNTSWSKWHAQEGHHDGKIPTAGW